MLKFSVDLINHEIYSSAVNISIFKLPANIYFNKNQFPNNGVPINRICMLLFQVLIKQIQ